MAAAVAKDSEVQIFREDQVKINTFAKKNHKLQVIMGFVGEAACVCTLGDGNRLCNI